MISKFTYITVNIPVVLQVPVYALKKAFFFLLYEFYFAGKTISRFNVFLAAVILSNKNVIANRTYKCQNRPALNGINRPVSEINRFRHKTKSHSLTTLEGAQVSLANARCKISILRPLERQEQQIVNLLLRKL